MPGTLENVTPSPIRGLVAFWNFDNQNSLSNDVAFGSHITLTEGSGTNHLTKVGDAGAATNYLVGTGAAGFTNGVGNYWRITSANAARLCQERSNYLSTVFWALHYDDDSSLNILGKDASGLSSDGTFKYVIASTANKLKQISSYHTSNDVVQVAVNTGNVITSNTWRFYTSTFSGIYTTLTFYINGTNYGIRATGNTNSASSRNFNIGTCGDASATSFNGNVDEVGIWSGARGGLSPTLTQPEINFLYNGGKGRRFPFNSGGNE